MKVLVIGGGGREHALAWKLAQSEKVSKVFVAPGNGGTALDPRLSNIELTDPQALRAWAVAEKIALTVVGPEQSLAAGVVDEFRAHGLRIFGPTRAAAQLESSKAFSKAFMQRHGIPTAAYETFSDPVAAHAYIDQHGVPIVVKADGLAAGKGVFVCSTIGEAMYAVDLMMSERAFGRAGDNILIEDRLDGVETSVLALTDGRSILPLPSSQDHKRAFDGDKGPNTGGMGAYSPADVLKPDVMTTIESEVLVQAVHALKRSRKPFKGLLYAGIMLTNQGPKVLEFNVRFGDPECQVLLMRLKSDLLSLLESVIDENLEEAKVEWDERPSITVVIAAEGYPGKYVRGQVITGLDKANAVPGVKVFHAGTIIKPGTENAPGGPVVISEGGRVLNVTAVGNTLQEARDRAYEACSKIDFPGGWYRKDIAWQALEPKAEPVISE